jgi:murein DD-endopeptidase MepM/ murein hydrolase activator NlpD
VTSDKRQIPTDYYQPIILTFGAFSGNISTSKSESGFSRLKLENHGAKLTPNMQHIVKRVERQVKRALGQGSNPVSAVLRTVFDKAQARNFIGSQIIAMSLVFSASVLPIHAFDYATSRPQYVDGTVFVPTTTEASYAFPVLRPLGVSQGYGRFHPAVDIRAPRGSEVVAIADGVVIETKDLRSGYGKYVRTLHEGEVVALSAHLDTVSVSSGEKISKGQQLGTVGMTGRTTGPHLHFELSQSGRYVDPMSLMR